MRCTKCGFELNDGERFCPACGTNAADIGIGTFRERLYYVFTDKLFLALCILTTSYTVLSLLSLSLPVIQILFTIFLWVIYSSAKNGEINDKMMRNVSGTVFAQKVLIIVLGSLLVLCFAIIAVILSVMGSTVNLAEIFKDVLAEYGADLNLQMFLNNASGIITYIVIIFILFLIGALVIAYIGTHCIHKFARSLYQSVQNPNLSIVKVHAAKNWLLTFAVFAGLSTLGNIENPLMLISGGINTAIYIIGFTLVGKYFNERKF